MTYPTAPLGVRIRAALYNVDRSAQPSTYTWTDITSRVHHMRDITDTIGASDDENESNTTLTFVLKNDDGIATTDNPESSWYPYFREGTPIEYALDVGAGFVVQVVAFVSALEMEWPSGTQYRCLVNVTCTGLFNEAKSGKAVRSPVYRTWVPKARRGIWMLEDEQGATQAASQKLSEPAMDTLITGIAPDFGQTAMVPGVARTCVFRTGATLQTYLNTPTSASAIRASFIMHVRTPPGVMTEVIALWNTNGGIARYTLEIGSGSMRIRAYNAAGTEISGASTFGFTTQEQQPTWIDIDFSQSGSNVAWTLRTTGWNLSSDGIASGGSAFASGSFAGTLGRIYRVVLGAGMNLDDVALNAVILNEAPLPSTGGFASVLGWAGNRATERVQGMANELGLPSTVTPGNLGVVMGPQRIDSLVANLRRVAATDHGILTDHLGTAGYRAHEELLNLAPAFTLSRTVRGHLSKDMRPTKDDSRKVNRASASRPGGSSATVEDIVDQQLSGLYERDPEEIDVAVDTVLLAHAGYYLARGTERGQRIAELGLNMTVAAATTPALPAQVLALKLGDRIAVSSLPPQAAKGSIERQVRGRTQVVNNRGIKAWDVTYQVVPVTPYNAFTFDQQRLTPAGSDAGEVIQSATSSDTVLMVAMPGTKATAGAGLSIPLDVAGERVNLTAVANESITDSFNPRTASNGLGQMPATAHIPAQTWICTGGTAGAADFSVSGSFAMLALPTTGARVASLQNIILLNPESITNVTFGTVIPAGGNLEVQINYRHIGALNTGYAFRLVLEPGNTTRVQLFQPGAASPFVDQPLSIIHGSGFNYWMLAAPIGNRHRLKIWTGPASNEPSNWLVDVVDDLPGARNVPGYTYIRAGRATGNTNSTAVANFDSYSIRNVQAFTVTRSLDGVVKAQAPGNPVQLWRPAGLAVGT